MEISNGKDLICPICLDRIRNFRNELVDRVNFESIELDGGALNYLDEIEELRLFLSNFLKTDLLSSLLRLKEELDYEPRYSEMYSWFIRHSKYGGECKYAINALKQFREKKVIKLIGLLKRSLKELNTL